MESGLHFRLQRLNTMVTVAVVVCSVFVLERLDGITLINEYADKGLVVLSSVGFYKLLIWAALKSISSFRPLLRLYWGNYYVHGYWSYSYTIEGASDNREYIGVWRFEQDAFRTYVTGFGLDGDFKLRSRVSSVSDMLITGFCECEVINMRTDSEEPGKDYYSRTTLRLEGCDSWLKAFPVRIRGHTVVYGGPRNSVVCNNVFIKHEDAKTEQDVVEWLLEQSRSGGGAATLMDSGRALVVDTVGLEKSI